MAQTSLSEVGASAPQSNKLFGRAFYESIGSPKMIVAPMVDRSEFAWRLLTRSYLDDEQSKSLLAYTPMLHARLFKDTPKFRDSHFQPTRGSLITKEKATEPPWLDGHPQHDRPLFVQFCANKPDELLEAAQYVAPYCDAVDLNLGCPQGIARSGHYGAFLQEDWDSIYKMINKLHKQLSIPVTAKMRVLETREKTLEYAKMILSAGASILTVHGRRREQKGHNMGVADWSMIRYLRDNLPLDTVLFANGNILNHGDVQKCLDATGADAIMSAEGNLSDPTIFAPPPADITSREYWVGSNGEGGYRLDGVFRRYMDIIYTHVLQQKPPGRMPLYVTGDELHSENVLDNSIPISSGDQAFTNPSRKRKRDDRAMHSPNLKAMQGHLFQLLRPILSIHTNIRDVLAETRAGDLADFERILYMVENAVRNGLDDEAIQNSEDQQKSAPSAETGDEETQVMTPSQKTIAKYKRPWWVCQPHIRPLPEEAIKLGSITLSRKDKARIEMEDKARDKDDGIQRDDNRGDQSMPTNDIVNEIPHTALVCG